MLQHVINREREQALGATSFQRIDGSDCITILFWGQSRPDGSDLRLTIQPKKMS
jgi:hypothetical protein